MARKFKLKHSGYNVRDPKTLELLNNYHSLDKETRGSYLIHANWVESTTAEAIAAHFAPSDRGRRLMLVSIILRDVDFHAKIQIFERILKRYYPEVLRNYPRLIRHLDKIRQVRNRYAHSVIDLRDRFLKQGDGSTLRYERHSGGKRRFEQATKRELEEEESLAGEVTELLTDLESYIREKAAAKHNKPTKLS